MKICFMQFRIISENVQDWHRGVKLRGYCFLKIIFYNVSKLKNFKEILVNFYSAKSLGLKQFFDQ